MRKLLMPFFMLGCFSDEETAQILDSAVRAGADMLELGIPHSDPLADGPVLRAAAARAIAGGMTPLMALERIGQLTSEFDCPVYVLTYLNTLYGCGVDAFAEKAVGAGVEGLVIPDLPMEALERLESEYDLKGLKIAAFTSPTSSQRLSDIAFSGSGIIYSVNYAGTTGGESQEHVDRRAAVNYKTLKALTDRPVLSGFGIDGPESAAKAAHAADGVIVGTKLQQLCDSVGGRERGTAVFEFLSEIRRSIDKINT